MNFETVDQVKDFMVEFQVNRRNVTLEQASYLRGLKYNRIKKLVGNNHSENERPSKEILAEEFNVSTATIMRDANFAKGIEKLEPELKDKILKGKSNVSKKDIESLAKIELPQKIEEIEEINAIITELKANNNEEKIENKNSIEKIDLKFLAKVVILKDSNHFISAENYKIVDNGIILIN